MNRRTANAIIIVILILVLLSVLPTWPYSGGWGWYPVGGVGLLLLVAIAALLLAKT
jgi:hypothetical protein